MAEISLRNITKYYGKDLILDNISIDIKNGEFFCITGPSGSGKTTLLNIIAGLDTEHSGSVYYNGKDVTYERPAQRNIAMIFQDYALYPNLIARENISFPLKLRRYSKDTIFSRVKSTVEQIDIGVERYLDFYPFQLSAGHKQRVAMGRAIIKDNPNIVLMDEPLSNLDAKMRMNTRPYLRKLVTDIKTTVIYVTSDSSEAMALADRLAFLDKGKFVQVGNPYEIYDNPKTIPVAGFFGVMGTNFLKGWIEDGDFVFNSNRVELPENFKGYRVNKPGRYPIILGVKPEEILISNKKTEGYLLAEIELIQVFPPKANIVCTINGFDMNVINYIKNIKDLRAGMHFYIKFNPDKIRFFNIESGKLVA